MQEALLGGGGGLEGREGDYNTQKQEPIPRSTQLPPFHRPRDQKKRRLWGQNGNYNYVEILADLQYVILR